MRTNIALALALLCCTNAGYAQPDRTRRSTTDFQHFAEVHAPDSIAPDAPYAVLLDANATHFFGERAECRLFDASGSEVPSLVHTAHAVRQAVPRACTIFNQAWEPGLIQTLSVDQGERAADSVNEFAFAIAEEEYHAQVQVEGSADGHQWRILRDNLRLIRLWRQDENVEYTHDTLRIPTSRFRYYRFTLAVSGRARPLTITGVTVREYVDREAAFLTVPLKPIPWQLETDTDTRHDYWMLDLEHTHLGITTLQFTLDGTEYSRPICVWEWDEQRKRPGRLAGSGVLFEYPEDNQTSVGLSPTQARRLIVRIDQGDNIPVRLVTAEARRPRLEVRFLAPPDPGLPLRLYVNPQTVQAPQYDVAQRIRQLKITAFAPLAHDPVQPNPAYREPVVSVPASERVPYLLYVLILPLVLGLGWYITRAIKAGVPPETSGDDT